MIFYFAHLPDCNNKRLAINKFNLLLITEFDFIQCPSFETEFKPDLLVLKWINYILFVFVLNRARPLYVKKRS